MKTSLALLGLIGSASGAQVCANWYGNNLDWTTITGTTRHGNTPWGIMADNECSVAKINGQGAYYCATMDTDTLSFSTCNGQNCKDGHCVNDYSLDNNDSPIQSETNKCRMNTGNCLQCQDGYDGGCAGWWTDWNMCSTANSPSHGGRRLCPTDMPYMCNLRTDENGHTYYPCVADASSCHEGLRNCPDSDVDGPNEATPAPTPMPDTPAPTPGPIPTSCADAKPTTKCTQMLTVHPQMCSSCGQPTQAGYWCKMCRGTCNLVAQLPCPHVPTCWHGDGPEKDTLSCAANYIRDPTICSNRASYWFRNCRAYCNAVDVANPCMPVLSCQDGQTPQVPGGGKLQHQCDAHYLRNPTMCNDRMNWWYRECRGTCNAHQHTPCPAQLSCADGPGKNQHQCEAQLVKDPDMCEFDTKPAWGRDYWSHHCRGTCNAHRGHSCTRSIPGKR